MNICVTANVSVPFFHAHAAYILRNPLHLRRFRKICLRLRHSQPRYVFCAIMTLSAVFILYIYFNSISCHLIYIWGEMFRPVLLSVFYAFVLAFSSKKSALFFPIKASGRLGTATAASLQSSLSHTRCHRSLIISAPITRATPSCWTRQFTKT